MSERNIMAGAMHPEFQAIVEKAFWIHEGSVKDAMFALPMEIAEGLGWTSRVEDGLMMASNDEILQALRQPIMLAAVLDDLARLLGIEPPKIVRLAIEGEAV